MLRFFRRIRRQLIEEGNLKRYLLYAVGEVVLIVAGILLALQIDNWNAARLSLAQEQMVLKDLYEELESNASILEQDIRLNRKMIEDIEFIVGHFDNKIPYSDSLAVLLPMMAWTHQVTLVSSAFESLKSSGFDIIHSNELKMQVIKLFDHEYGAATKWINELSIEKHREFREVFNAFPRGGISSDNFEEILANDQLYNLLATYKGWKEALINREIVLLENTNTLKARVGAAARLESR